MQTDLPHTLYMKERNKGKNKRKGDDFKYNPNDPALAKQMEAIRKKRELMAAKERGEIPYTSDELFK